MTAGRRSVVAVLALGACTALGARLSGLPPEPERRLVLAANGDRVEHRWWLPLQQLGTPWVLPGTAVVGLATGRHDLGVAAALALPAEKALEVAIKRWAPRLRPGYAVTGVHLDDDAPKEGPSYPSGHAAIATCAATLVWPHLGRRTRLLLVSATGGAGYARVHQGAHYAGDILGGVLLGVGVGSALSVLGEELAARLSRLL